jgi:ABC-type glycerol-3-phosphate transport system substrate-binding protein
MKLRPFELALVIIFIVLGLAALALLSGYDRPPSAPDGSVPVTGAVQIWGVMPGTGMDDMLDSLSEQFESYQDVTYRYVPPAEFDDRLLNALADGVGPDIILMSHEELVDMRRRIVPYDYDVVPQRDIRDLYIEGAQIFALNDGFYALPIAVDPMVMYWNRDLLATQGFLAPPRTWEELLNVQFDELIERDFDRTIRRGVVAMGEYANVRNAFGVMSMLLMQGGTSGVIETDRGYEIKLQQSVTGTNNPLRTAVDFYTRFSQPSNTYYSWNRSLPEDRMAFIGEQLAFYFGYASEARELEQLNPNLNFDIAEVPQGAAASVRRTYGRFYGLALLRTSDNPAGAYAVMAQLNNASVAATIAQNSGLAPVSRQAISAGSNDTYGRIAYQSAAISYGWLNPNALQTKQIFATMASDVNENRRSLDQTVSDGLERLEQTY